MIKIIDAQGSGKTKKLMNIAKENNAIFVCANPKAMEQKAHAYGIIGLNFISYHDLIKEYYHKSLEEQNFVIDEIECFIEQTCAPSNWNFIGYTDTID